MKNWYRTKQTDTCFITWDAHCSVYYEITSEQRVIWFSDISATNAVKAFRREEKTASHCLRPSLPFDQFSPSHFWQERAVLYEDHVTLVAELITRASARWAVDSCNVLTSRGLCLEITKGLGDDLLSHLIFFFFCYSACQCPSYY